MRHMLLSSLVGLVLVTATIAAVHPRKSKDVATTSSDYSFEEKEVPPAWQNEKLNLSVSTQHFKSGQQSLCWEWHGGENLLVRQPEGLREAVASDDGGIQLWIYNETPSKTPLTFRFGSISQLASANGAPYQFEFGLNFQGWRACWVQFREDATNKAASPSVASLTDSMQIIAPAGSDVRSGRLFFDQVEFVSKMEWFRTPDYQLPYINAKLAAAGVSDDMKDEHIDLSAYTWSQLKAPPAPAVITEQQKFAFKTIADRYDQWIYGTNLDVTSDPIYVERFAALNKFIKSGKAVFAKLNIHRENGVITGTPLFALVDTKHKPPFTDVFSNCILPLVFDWKLNHIEESRNNFFDLLDYIHDQGWDEGSANGTLDHQPLRVSGYMHAVYLMRDELKAAGRLQHELATMRWYTYFGQGYWSELPPGNSSDEIRNAMLHKLLYVLASEDSPQKVRDMESLMFWENQAISIAPGWVDCIKPDYVGFHHRGIYGNTYATDAFHMAALVFWLQHGTPFAMSDQSADNIRNALLTNRILTNKYYAPMSISGRMPFAVGTSDRVSPGYAYMALAADTPDHQMAAAFKRLWNPEDPTYGSEVIDQAGAGIFYWDPMGSLQLMKQVADSAVKPEPAPSGNWIKPYAGMMVHRRDEWMLSVKGWSKYVWNYERGATENVFGRNMSNGYLQILGSGKPVTRSDSGCVEAGWNWSRLPGTTAISYSLDELKSGEVMRDFSDQTFVGGVSLAGQDGLFAMHLHDTVKDPSFHANKSVFCFGNRVVCLGSRIIDSDTKRTTQTTVFQTSLPSPNTPNNINSTAAALGLSADQSFSGGKSVWLTDSVGNGYIIPHADGLHVQRQHQESIDNSGKTPTAGDFTTAWIDHGAAPKDAGYEYGILVQAGSPDAVAQFAAAPGYEVLRRDDHVHAVHDKQSHETGIAVFDAATPVKLDVLQSVDKPCMAILRQDADRLTVTIADPDLGLIPPNEPQPTDIIGGMTARHLLRASSPKSIVRVTLAGTWQASGSDKGRIVSSSNGNTVVDVECQNGLTTELALTCKH